ncbi:MAG: hypothetical protein ACREDS_15150 [Limisphaerales bacterium]
MNATALAKAVSHWLEFERLCGRAKLFSESSLKLPVHEFLTAEEPYEVKLEEELPGIPRKVKAITGRKKSVDFSLRRTGGRQALKNVIESKFINMRRAFAQEVLNDLFRLRWLRPQNQTEPCQRWLLIAGTWGDLKVQILSKGSTIRKPILDTGLYGVLHRTINKLHTASVRGVSQTQTARWERAADQLLQTRLPSAFKTKLEACSPIQPAQDTDMVCMIWRVIKPVRRHHN